MSDVFIVYPFRGYLPAHRIESLYADAIANGEIAKEYRNARTVVEKARALDNAGIITRGKPS